MGKVLLWGVTKGRGSGIGIEVAKLLTSTGTEIVIAGRKEDQLKIVAEHFNCNYFVTSGKIEPISYNHFLEENEITSIVSFVGVGYPQKFMFIDDEKMQDMMDSNFMFNYDLIRKSFPYLKKTGCNVIFANSIAGIVSSEGASGYTASKFALRGFLESARNEIKPAYKFSLSSIYFQSIRYININAIYDCILTSLRNRDVNFDFVLE